MFAKVLQQRGNRFRGAVPGVGQEDSDLEEVRGDVEAERQRQNNLKHRVQRSARQLLTLRPETASDGGTNNCAP